MSKGSEEMAMQEYSESCDKEFEDRLRRERMFLEELKELGVSNAETNKMNCRIEDIEETLSSYASDEEISSSEIEAFLRLQANQGKTPEGALKALFEALGAEMPAFKYKRSY